MEKKKIIVNIVYNDAKFSSMPTQYLPPSTFPVMQYPTANCESIQMYGDLEQITIMIKDLLNSIHLNDAIIKLDDVWGMTYFIPMNNVKSIRVAPEGTPGFVQMIWPENLDKK